jgi:Ankyrin repeats (3 copies)
MRPLRVEELAEVLAIRFEARKSPEYHSGWRLEDSRGAVLFACSSLILVVNVDGSQIVQFSHLSVKEFLSSGRLAKAEEDLSGYRILPQAAHTILTQACLSTLLRIDDQVDKEKIKKFPLSIYAAQYWIEHAQFENVSSRIAELMEELFDPDKRHFARWVWIFDVDRPWDWVEHMSSERPTQPEAAGLYYASLYGFRGVVEHLIASCPGGINASGGIHGTPLQASLIKGYFDIALLLLEHGADANAIDDLGRSPLNLASKSGCLDTAKFLLDFQPDANIHDGDGEIAPHVASRTGEAEVGRCGTSLRQPRSWFQSDRT